MQISLAGKVRTLNPAWRSRVLVLRFSSMANNRFAPSARTLQASVSRLGGVDLDSAEAAGFEQFYVRFRPRAMW